MIASKKFIKSIKKTLASFFIFLFLITSLALVFAQIEGLAQETRPSTSSDGLVSYWKLDGHANDSVGSNNGIDTAVYYYPFTVIENDGAFNDSPSLAVMDDGSLIVVYKKSTLSENYAVGSIIMKTSSDGGNTWSAESTIYTDGVHAYLDPSVTVLANGDLMVSFSEYVVNGAPQDSSVYVIRSTDNGANWGSTVLVNDSFSAWSASANPVIQLVNGDLLMSFYGLDTGDSYTSARLMKSTNGGASWSNETVIADGEADAINYQEPNLLLLANGDVYCLIRASNKVMYHSTSTNSGVTWPVVMGSFAANGAPKMLLLSNGNIFCTTRVGQTAVAFQSSDSGITWSSGVTFWDWMMTYASAVQIAGNIFIAYGAYQSPTDGHIHFATYPQGKINLGAGFNGTSSKISLGTAITMPTNLTIRAWVKRTANSGYATIFGDFNMAGNLGYELMQHDQKLEFEWVNAAGGCRKYGTNNNVITDADWHFVVLTQTGTASPTFYVDGRSVASSILATNGTDTKPIAQGSAIGVAGACGWGWFNGVIDEVGVWSRVLSSSEVSKLYNSGSGITYPFSGSTQTSAEAIYSTY